MSSAYVYSVRGQNARGVVWKWRALAGAKTSMMAFASYEDCVADAKKSGYQVEPMVNGGTTG